MSHKNPLQIVAVEKKDPSSQKPSCIKTSREEIQARFERMWRQNPQQFDPLRNCMERERLKRTFLLIQKYISLKEKKIGDLGCGAGRLSQTLNEAGGVVEAIDVATIALEKIREKALAIKTIQDCLPSTLLKDDAYDVVVCTDVIAYLPDKDHRLFFNELARLVKKDGYVVCSTPIDLNSEDALQRFASLAQTELEFLDWIVSYHRLYIALRSFCEAPDNFFQASWNEEFRNSKLAERNSFWKWWFKINSTPYLRLFWKTIAFGFNPIARFIKDNRTLMLILEKVSRFLYGEAAISHAIFIGKRRLLIEPPAEIPPVFERKQKKTVWE